MSAFLFVAGLALLIVGAESLVRGASRLAARLGVPPLIVGLTVVAYGTSAPELAVSVTSTLESASGIALGNVLGSNIFNVLFILGASALVAPLVVSKQLVRLDVPVMIGLSCLLAVLALDGALGRRDALVLAVGALLYTGVLAAIAMRSKAGEKTREVTRGVWPVDIALIVGGLAMLVLGSRWFLESSIGIARALGVSELIVGLTIVAAGTSLPEVATSILASVRGERDIAVGNIVGSNIFNLLAVLGISGLVAPEGIPVPSSALRFDIPVMVGASLACLPVFFTGYRIARWEGALFLGYYVAYTAFLVLDASGHRWTRAFGEAIAYFVLPLTALTLAVFVGRSIAIRKRPPPGTSR